MHIQEHFTPLLINSLVIYNVIYLIYNSHFNAIKWKIPSVACQIPARNKCTLREEYGINDLYLFILFPFLANFPNVIRLGRIFLGLLVRKLVICMQPIARQQSVCGGRPGARALSLHSLAAEKFISRETQKAAARSRDAHFVCDRFGRRAKGADDVFKTLSSQHGGVDLFNPATHN